MRTKEDSMDYRYFPDPDLQPLEISDEWIDEVRVTIPELPGATLNRLIQKYGINEADAIQFTSHRPLTVYFETAAANVKDKKAVANWIRGEVLAKLNAAELTIEESPVSAEQVGQILNRMSDGTLQPEGRSYGLLCDLGKERRQCRRPYRNTRLETDLGHRCH